MPYSKEHQFCLVASFEYGGSLSSFSETPSFLLLRTASDVVEAQPLQPIRDPVDGDFHRVAQAAVMTGIVVPIVSREPSEMFGASDLGTDVAEAHVLEWDFWTWRKLPLMQLFRQSAQHERPAPERV